MSQLTPSIVDEVRAACEAEAAELGAALGRAFDGTLTVVVGQPATLQTNALPEGVISAGLAFAWTVGDVGAILLLAETARIVPEWCAAPDPSGQSRLATLGQELGLLLFPPQVATDSCVVGWTRSLAGALARGEVAEGAAIVPLEIVSAGSARVTAQLIWPALRPAAVLETVVARSEPAARPQPVRPAPVAAPPVQDGTHSLRDLPAYTRSLLRIRVPVVVSLAEKRQPLGRIVELGPGAIIQFDKSCEEMLELSVGDHPIACGEAVKVGDKFGLRVTSMTLPEERFGPAKR